MLLYDYCMAKSENLQDLSHKESALKSLPDYVLNEHMIQAFEGKIPFVELHMGNSLVVLDANDLASESLRRTAAASMPLSS